MKNAFLTLICAGFLLVGCNTMEGMGQDIQAGGAAIEDAAAEDK